GIAPLAGSYTGNSRRIQLLADGRYFRARPPGKSDSPDVDELRNVSRELVSDLFLDVSAGAGFRNGHRTVAWQSMDRRAAERCRHVCRDPLDAASVDAGAMGVIGRRVRWIEFGNRELLDEQLLGWGRGGRRRSACTGGPGAHLAAG